MAICAGVSAFVRADATAWPLAGVRPGVTRVLAVLLGGYFFLMFLDGLKRLFSKSGPTPGTGATPGPSAEASLTPVQRAAAKYLHLLAQHGIAAGHVPTAEEVGRLADALNDDEAWAGPVDATDYAALWVDRAPAAALDTLLAVLDGGRRITLPDDDDYDDGLVIALGQWGRQRLHPWLEEVAMRLERPRSRAAAFAVMGWNPCSELFPLLVPWLPRVNELTEPEQLVLIAMFGDVKSPQGLPVLQQLQATLRDPAAEVLSELKGYIKQLSQD